jgi:NADPH:quinone reductase-like Zn-dependent oxidoreductase
MWGLTKPKIKILGSDIAGRIEAVGDNVKRFQPGDEVFGDIMEHWGGFAEYVCAPESMLTLKPAGMTFEQAAALPQAAVVALQGIRDKGNIQPGQKVMINGAGGGSGSFALQLARMYDAEVTGIDSGEKLDTMRSNGADHVIDYTKEDFAIREERYDLILDLAAHRSIFDYRRVLQPNGVYLLVGGSMPRILQAAFLGPLISIAGSRKMGMLLVKQNKGLDYLSELVMNGTITPVIDRTYPLDEAPEALRYLGEGHARGKVIITV